MEIYGRVRRAVRVEGRSQRAVARSSGFRERRYGRCCSMRCRRAISGSSRSSDLSWGRGWASSTPSLEDDKQRPPKQRHTAKRIFDRLKEEHGFTGGYTIVKDYVRTATLRGQEMFVPLTHAAGEAQVDFGEALVVIAGVEAEGALPGDGPASLG